MTTIMLAGVLMMRPWLQGQIIETGVGEQRLVLLEDGSRLSLNTDSRVRVLFTPNRRSIELEAGEAYFEVAKAAGRPFVVRAGKEEVVATGTAFGVQLRARDAGLPDLAVTLVEGSVVVRAVAEAGNQAPEVVSSLVMSAGERLRIGGARAAADGASAMRSLDRPRVDHLLAWKRGEVVFDDLPLTEAIAEMNRYSSAPIRLIPSDKVNQLRISGTFKIGDDAMFARAVAALHGLSFRADVRLELAAPKRLDN